jgi:hypothetical protein
MWKKGSDLLAFNENLDSFAAISRQKVRFGNDLLTLVKQTID